MGTITIEEYNYVGGRDENDAPIPNLVAMTRTQDASTSTSPESLVLQPKTSAIRVVADADHRISITDATAATNYATVGTTAIDYGVNGGDTLYYRADA
tara:strand:+ start:1514 stop:1807 length:294 start_codon:yes stop_codon:yes gene_type:complete